MIDGELLDEKIEQKIFARSHKGKMEKFHAIAVHRTGGANAASAFDSFKNSPNGARFLIDKYG